MRLTNLLVGWIKADNRFELAAPVVMPVVCFRWVESARCADRTPQRSVPTESTTDIVNSRIVERINASGRAYLTQTKLRGRTVMRIGLGNVLTTEQHLRNVWELIQKTAQEYLRPENRTILIREPKAAEPTATPGTNQ